LVTMYCKVVVTESRKIGISRQFRTLILLELTIY